MSELDVSEEDVRKEHMEQVRPGSQWLYLVAVLGGGFILMVVLIAALGAVA
jgi:hypothetical protein